MTISRQRDDRTAGRLLRALLLWALTGSLALGVLELFLGMGSSATGAPGFWPGVLVSLLLHLAWSFPVAVALSLAISWAATRLSRIPTAHLFLALIWLAPVLPVLVLGIAQATPALERVTDPILRGMLLATGALGLLAIGGVVGGAMVLFSRRLLTEVTGVAVRVLGAVLALLGIAWLSVLSHHFRVGGLQGQLFLPSLGTLFLSLLTLGLARPSWVAAGRRVHLHWPRILVVGLGAPLLLVALAEGTSRVAPNGSRWAAGRPACSAQVLLALREVVDLDGDGASAILGGGDCDDWDFLRYPGAVDEPGDGIDQNCDGADATVDEKEGVSAYFLSPEEGQRYHVVLICVDAFRADRASFLGYNRKTTPNLEVLARKSWVFENAIAPSSTTRESIPPLFTGRYPSGIAWEGESRIRQVSASQALLAEILASAGWQTLAVADEWLLKFLPTTMRGFQRSDVAYGLGRWREVGQRAGPFTFYDAIEKLMQRDRQRPFLLYVHFEAPHYPYVFHEGIPSFGGRPSDLYDHELAYADRYIGMLLEYLETEGLIEKTIIVVFGDHGEEFQEHGGTQHSRTLHAESVRVPLVVHIPGQTPARIKTRVSLVDVFPTLMDALGLRPEEPVPQGFSLFHHVGRPDPFPDRPIFSELMVNNEGTLRYRKAIYQGRHKLLWDMSSNETLLYDVVADPMEKHPLEDPDVHQRLFQVLSDFVARGTHRPGR